MSEVVRASVDPDMKREASAVLQDMGLSLSDAYRLLLARIARDKALPFEPFPPNAETVAAMEEARRGGLQSYPSFEALVSDLDAED